MKVETISFGSVKSYAKVASRLKDFREKNPRASVKTTVTPTDSGVMVQAYILSDKADESSADATGTAFYPAKQMQENKAFEKLETIAVGRALALLGWLNDGEIATSEEMEEFLEFKFDNLKKEIEQATKREQFQAVLAKANAMEKRELTPLINARIAELKEQSHATKN